MGLSRRSHHAPVNICKERRRLGVDNVVMLERKDVPRHYQVFEESTKSGNHPHKVGHIFRRNSTNFRNEGDACHQNAVVLLAQKRPCRWHEIVH